MEVVYDFCFFIFFNLQYPLVNVNIAIVSMAIEIVDFPINNMAIFHSYVNVYQIVLFLGNHVKKKILQIFGAERLATVVTFCILLST